MGEDYVEVLAALVDSCSQSGNLGARAHDYQQFQLAVVCKLYVFIVGFHCFSTGSKNVSG